MLFGLGFALIARDRIKADGPFATIDYVSAADQHALGYSAGGMFGFTWIPWDVLDISLGAGAEFRDQVAAWDAEV